MKIYFAGSIKGGRADVEIYSRIIELLKSHGEVLTEHIGDSRLSSHGETGFTVEEIYERDTGWLRDSDIMIAEVTTPSLGVGYEIALAESMGKKILCLYRESPERRLSSMIKGNPNITVSNYKDTDELPSILEAFFREML